MGIGPISHGPINISKQSIRPDRRIRLCRDPGALRRWGISSPSLFVRGRTMSWSPPIAMALESARKRFVRAVFVRPVRAWASAMRAKAAARSYECRIVAATATDRSKTQPVVGAGAQETGPAVATGAASGHQPAASATSVAAASRARELPRGSRRPQGLPVVPGSAPSRYNGSRLLRAGVHRRLAATRSRSSLVMPGLAPLSRSA